MDAGTLLWIVLIGVGVFGMYFMHRGGHAHGVAGGCGGHGHGDPSSDKHEEEGREEGKKQPLDAHGSQGHNHEPAAASGGKHRGC